MASRKSWVSSVTSRRNLRLSDPDHELPRWRTPSPMAESMIPPPIVQSTYGPPRSIVIEPAALEKPSHFEGRQQELEADLQFLLDAQADGLSRGLEAGLAADRSSTGSVTPTLRSAKGASAGPSLMPSSRRKPGLRSTRKGIYGRILALSSLKDEEMQDADLDVYDLDQTLNQINTWETKRKGLQEASQHVDASDDTVRVERLKQEADALQMEINKVELHLMELKTKQRKLLKQAGAVENSVQAKLASYSSSLRMLEEDIEKFLAVPPDDFDLRQPSIDADTSVWQLPPRRRTLSLAKEYWVHRRTVAVQQREGIEHEQSALTEGASVWGEAVAEITEFEKLLRTEMAALSPPPIDSKLARGKAPQRDQSGRLEQILNRMGQVITSLETRLDYAEERNWNLLIAAIGAELDALQKGKKILQGLIGMEDDEEAPGEAQDGAILQPNAVDQIDELDRSFVTARRPSLNRRVSATSDDPDPELLFSMQEEADE